MAIDTKVQAHPVRSGRRSRSSKSGNARDEAAGDRRQAILDAAGALFARKGFAATGMREIAESVGILGGSLYHHFASKEGLYLEVHEQALARAGDQLRAAIECHSDPWQRLKAACTEHISIQTSPGAVTAPLMSDLQYLSPELQVDLIRQRDAWEELYKSLVDALPLDPAINRNIYRISLLVLVNSTPVWFRPGKLSAEELAEQIIQIFRHAEAAATP